MIAKAAANRDGAAASTRPSGAGRILRKELMAGVCVVWPREIGKTAVWVSCLCLFVCREKLDKLQNKRKTKKKKKAKGEGKLT